jgi:hypothetical protein
LQPLRLSLLLIWSPTLLLLLLLRGYCCLVLLLLLLRWLSSLLQMLPLLLALRLLLLLLLCCSRPCRSCCFPVHLLAGALLAAVVCWLGGVQHHGLTSSLKMINLTAHRNVHGVK